VRDRIRRHKPYREAHELTGDDNSSIVVSRKMQYFGADVPVKILVDGETATRLWIGQSKMIATSAGSHVVAAQGAWGPTQSVEITIDVGETQATYLRLSLTGGTTGQWRLERREIDDAPAVTYTCQISELSRSEVVVGEETRRIDNSRGVSTIVRKFKISREWTRSFTFDTERTTTRGAQAGIDFTGASIRGQIETSIRDYYRTSEQERHLFEDEVTISIAPQTLTRAVFTWKEIRQNGYVDLRRDDLVVAQVPFEIIIGLSFDQQQIDERSQM
jgi:hypothetical protein